MRIIAGKYRGKRLNNPVGTGVRPTSDRVKEALFSVLNGIVELKGSRVLDLYAGSGALGIEALSRGAELVEFVESHRKRAEDIKKTVKELGENATCHISSMKVSKYLRSPNRKSLFNVVMIDPPYDEHPGELLFEYLDAFNGLSDGACVVIEGRSSLTLKDVSEGSIGRFVLERQKTYGTTGLWFYIYNQKV